MTQSKHTPGPWVAHEGWANACSGSGDEDPDWCEITGPDNLSVSGHFGIANARLIAAAPDMLAALSGDADTPPSINPMSWLHEAIEELRNRGPAADCEDPDAFWTMVRECESLERLGRAALSKATS